MISDRDLSAPPRFVKAKTECIAHYLSGRFVTVSKVAIEERGEVCFSDSVEHGGVLGW